MCWRQKSQIIQNPKYQNLPIQGSERKDISNLDPLSNTILNTKAGKNEIKKQSVILQVECNEKIRYS